MTTVKSRHAPTIWKKLTWKPQCLPILKSITEITKILRVYMVLGDAVLKLETFVWILKHISRFIAWSLFILKASYKWPVSTLSFMWWCQFIDLLKFETRSSFLLNFGTANVKHSEREILRDLSSTYLPKRGLVSDVWRVSQDNLSQNAVIRLAKHV